MNIFFFKNALKFYFTVSPFNEKIQPDWYISYLLSSVQHFNCIPVSKNKSV
jgi:hypothetical protein